MANELLVAATQGGPRDLFKLSMLTYFLFRIFGWNYVCSLGASEDRFLAMSDEVEEFILKIYDAVSDQKRWQTVLDQLVDRVGAQGSIVFEWRKSEVDLELSAPLFSSFYNTDALKIYLDKCAHLEARDQEALRFHTSQSDKIDLLEDKVLANSIDSLQLQEHTKSLSRFGIHRRAAGVLNKDNRWISLFSLQFNSKKDPINIENRQLLTKLLPHIAKALDLGLPVRQLGSLNQGLFAAINQLTIGICVLDKEGNIVVQNSEFQRQREEYKVFRVSSQGDLSINGDKAQERFEALKRNARNHGQFGARPRKEAINNTVDPVLCIEVVPLTYSDEFGSQAFRGSILSSTDTSLPVDCDPFPMKSAFGLTSAEMEVVRELGQGLTNPEIAERRERSVATINTQVKSVLSKSQCGNRTQFVRMMLRFGASFLSNSNKDIL